MSKLVNQLVEAGYTDHILTERQIASVLKGSESRRYGLVNRALKDESLTRLKRGIYALGPRYRSTSLHPFAIAQAILPGSYISMETALSYHGWIPEAVYETISIRPGRKTLNYQNDKFGQFTFIPLAHNKYQFLQSVSRQKTETQTVLVAEPLRALMDLVAYRKKNWSNINWVEQGLRIELTNLTQLQAKDFESIDQVYKNKRVHFFQQELKNKILRMIETT